MDNVNVVRCSRCIRNNSLIYLTSELGLSKRTTNVKSKSLDVFAGETSFTRGMLHEEGTRKGKKRVIEPITKPAEIVTPNACAVFLSSFYKEQ